MSESHATESSPTGRSESPVDHGIAEPQGSVWAELWFKRRYLLLSLVMLVLDQWSKWMIEAHLEGTLRYEVIPGLLNFVHVRNTGVAFGMFAARGDVTATWTLTLLGLAALTFVTYYFARVPRSDRMLLVALALVIGGAIGNLVDRIAQGGVTDWVDFYFGTYHWHTFNIADAAITIGIGLMLLGTFQQPGGATSETAEDDAAPEKTTSDEPAGAS